MKIKKLSTEKIVEIFIIIILAICAETRYSFHDALQKIVFSLFAVGGIVRYYTRKRDKTNEKLFRTLIDGWIPFALAAVYTIIITLAGNEYNLPIAGHAFTTAMFALIQMLFVYSLISKYYEKAVDIVFYYICVSYTITIITEIHENSIGYILKNYNSIYNPLERHDVGTAVVPLILLYLYRIFYMKERCKKNWRRIFIASAILLLCGKRSALVSIVIGFIVLFIASAPIKDKGKLFNLIGFGTVIVLLFYVIAIKTRLLMWTCIKLGISTEGRIYVWDWFRNMYSISPFYFGRGLQFVHEYMNAHIAENGSAISMVSNFGFLHNSDLQVYIELGFWGFLFWFEWFLFELPKIIKRRFGKETFYLSVILIVTMVYIFMTDNVMTYPVFQTTLYTAMFSIVAEQIGCAKKIR